MNLSTWMDYNYTATGLTELEYSIYEGHTENYTWVNDRLIYTGKAVARPDEGFISINISPIVQNYLNSELPDVAFNYDDFNTGTMNMPNSIKRFALYDSKGNQLDTFKYINCWDYETRFESFETDNSYSLSVPANSHSVYGMYDFSTSYYKTNGGEVKTTISDATNRGESPSGDTPSVNTSDRCGNGALYYSNAKGGWDSFLIEGNIKKSDAFEKYTINQKWYTGTLNSGTRTLVNTVTESWVLMTHLLTDNEMKIIAANLFGSNNIYFHDLVSDKIYPVKITDTKVEYKTRKNNKNKVYYATINIESTQPKQRI